MKENLISDEPKKSRLVHIDACRGLAIMLVVYWHVILATGTMSELCIYFALFREPVFFAISGFFMFSIDYDVTKCSQKSLNRVVRQLYPTILLWLCCVVCTSIYRSKSIPSLLALLCNPYKHGYWFTFTVVELCFIALPWLILFNRKQWRKREITLILIALCLFFISVEPVVYDVLGRYWLVDIIGNAVTITGVVGNAWLFFLGMIAKLHHQSLDRIAKKWKALVIALLCFAVSSRLYLDVTEGAVHTMAHYMGALSGMAALYCMFLKLSLVKNIVIRKIIYWLTIVGKKTLEIYLIHWFVLLFTQPLIVKSGIGTALNTWYEFPVVLSFAVAIAIIILGFVKLLKLMGIYEIIFPQSTEKVSAFFNVCKTKLKLGY